MEMFRKKKRLWLPALYVVALSVVVGGAYIYQNRAVEQAIDVPKVEKEVPKPIQVPVAKPIEKLAMPVAQPEFAQVVTPFYDVQLPAADQEKAIVGYEGTYYPNSGINVAMKDGKSFDVLAAFSGEVVKAEEDSLLGYVVTVKHDSEIETVYQSLSSIQVKVGSLVKQGQILGVSGTSKLYPNVKQHVHFELRHEQQALNPVKLWNATLAMVAKPAAEEKRQASAPDATISFGRS